MGYWEWDSSTNEVVLSEEMQRIVGYDRAHAKFSGRPDIIHPDDIVKLQYAIEEARKGGSPIIDFRLVFPNGDTKWMQAGSTYIDRDSANGGRYFGYALDITDSKLMGEALKDSEETLKQAQHLAQVGSWTWNLKDNSFVLSDEMSNLYGFGKSEIRSLENILNTFIHPDDRETVFEAAGKVLTDVYGDPLVYRIIKPDGEVRWMSATIPEVRHFDVDGNPEVMVGAVQDITQQKQAEEALRESEEKLRTVFDSIGDGITVLDLAGNIIDVNETVLRIKGYNREDVIGRFGLDFILEKDRARATEEMMVLFNGELEKTPFKEYALLGKDGSKIPCEASASLLRDGDGNIVGLISVERDLRERKKTESYLQESESLLRQAEKLAGIGSWQWSLRTNKFVMSEGMSLLYGTEGKEFAHLKDIVETLIHPDDREEVYRAAEGMVVEGFGETLIYRVIRPDGEVRWINATIPEVRRFGEDGKPEIVFGAVQDVTEHKQAEQQLRAG
jgi:PAS domain S-box-containing protein